jgi:hypothetical protein
VPHLARPLRPARVAPACAVLALALALSGCASDQSVTDRFRLAGSLSGDVLPGTGSGLSQCNDFHRSLRGRTPAQQQAELQRAWGVTVDAQRAARHVEALEQLCSPGPSGG